MKLYALAFYFWRLNDEEVNKVPCENTTVQHSTTYTDPERHNTDRRTDRQTDDSIMPRADHILFMLHAAVGLRSANKGILLTKEERTEINSSIAPAGICNHVLHLIDANHSATYPRGTICTCFMPSTHTCSNVGTVTTRV